MYTDAAKSNPSDASIDSTQGIENDVSARLPNITYVMFKTAQLCYYWSYVQKHIAK